MENIDQGMVMNDIKYFVDADGNFLGAFHNAVPPIGAIEVPTAPEHAEDKWTGLSWNTSIRGVDTRPLDVEELYEILEIKGVLDASDRPRPKPLRR